MRKYRLIPIVLVLLLAFGTFAIASPNLEGEQGSWLGGCTGIMVGKDATVDGSVIGTYSCDGAMYAKTVVVPGVTYKEGATLPIYYRPYSNNYAAYIANLDKEEKLGEIPQVEETYRYISNIVYYDDQNCGGVNEHGLCIGETTIGGNRDLRNSNGWMYAYSNYPSTSLMALGLQRAKTAREAVKIIGALAEEYGYAQSGEHLTITDKNEAWAMEIFGPGRDWTHESGKPGAVWAARRVPDGEIAFSANSSRLGLMEEVVEDGEDFMNSSNTFTLAEELGLWEPGTPFVWYKVYGNRNDRHSLREWSIVNKYAPSLGVEVDDPIFFSFKPDEKVSVQDVMEMYRDYFTGIPELDVTMNEAYKLSNGKVSPMAGPYGPSALHSLLGVSTQRSVGTRSSVFTYVTQHKDWLPDPVGTCMWYTPGTALTGSYTPIYAGTLELPEAWTDTPMTYVDRDSAWWAFTMTEGLSHIEWQNAIKDIKAVRDPAETSFLAEQADVEAVAAELYNNERGKSDEQEKGGNANQQREAHGKLNAERYLTEYTNKSLNAIGDTYWDLVDYLMFKYYFRAGKSIPATMPVVPALAS
jgi:dipeptidase